MATLSGVLCFGMPGSSDAEETDQRWQVHAQTTYIFQAKPGFSASYSGPNSLSPRYEDSYSWTITAMLGLRLWQGAALYFNPEAAQGVPLSRLTGLGGFTNGEISRTAGPRLTLYRARLYMQQYIALDRSSETVEETENQLRLGTASRRLVLTAGNLSLLDLFDNNSVAHDPRTDFLNWAFMTYAAYDYAADARGYSWGAVAELYWDNWAVRLGRFAQPKQPNQLPLDSRIFRHFGDQLEIERRYTLANYGGALRLLAMRNRARMARYLDALRAAERDGGTPSLDRVRTDTHDKLGVGLSLEQTLPADLRLFARGFWADGATETYAFTEADRSLAAGLVMSGSWWGRSLDRIGYAAGVNWLSPSHRRYLERGGRGFFLGDGGLDYRPEAITEVFYAVPLLPILELTLDFQHIWNPGYNAARGPVQVWSTRVHVLL
ncbi:MAG: carbohydrate porin [Candidatus Binatia bacterium]|nr:carbohydrate porin [Candidatus Binatia bacterium]